MRAAPRPTKSSTNSEAETAKKGTPASPATARAAGAGQGREVGPKESGVSGRVGDQGANGSLGHTSV